MATATKEHEGKLVVDSLGRILYVGVVDGAGAWGYPIFGPKAMVIVKKVQPLSAEDTHALTLVRKVGEALR